MENKNFNKIKGFTLMELLIYVGGLVVLGTVLTLMVVQFYGLYKEIISVPRADRVGLSLVDRITKEIRSADQIDPLNSQFGTSTGVLEFSHFNNGDITEKKFYLENGIVKYVENEGSPSSEAINLTPKDLVVSNFYLSFVSTPVSESVRLNLEIQFDNKNGTETKSYTGFATLRESYD